MDPLSFSKSLLVSLLENGISVFIDGLDTVSWTEGAGASTGAGGAGTEGEGGAGASTGAGGAGAGAEGAEGGGEEEEEEKAFLMRSLDLYL